MKIKEIIPLVLSPLATNCYIVPVGGGEAAVIDPADDYPAIVKAAGELKLKYVLLTHGHFDHTGAAASVRDGVDRTQKPKKGAAPSETAPTAPCTDVPIYIHSADVGLLTDADKALAFFCPGKPYFPFGEEELALLKTVEDGDVIRCGEVEFKVMSTPGHTAGSVCFLCSDEDGRDIMFAGDTIFKDSIGRSDGYSGDPSVQFESLEKLKALDKDYIILPGHGESTTLFTEKRFNPFLSDIYI